MLLTLGILFYIVMFCFFTGVLFGVLEYITSAAFTIFVSCVGILAVTLWPVSIVLAVMYIIGLAGYNAVDRVM